MSHLTKLLPNINLVDENNETHQFHDLIKNKTVILSMFYSNCQIKCIPSGKLMKRVNLLIKNYLEKEDIVFISITLNAKNDTVEDINNFKDKVWDEKCENWHFYTGNFEDIEKLRFKIGMYNPEPEIDAIKSNHPAGYLLFNEKMGFTKHTEGFDNPVDIARKIIQMIPKNFYSHTYDLSELDFSALTDDEIFENMHTMNSMFTVSFLPKYIVEKYDVYAEEQRGFQYDPYEEKKGECCCCCQNK